MFLYRQFASLSRIMLAILAGIAAWLAIPAISAELPAAPGTAVPAQAADADPWDAALVLADPGASVPALEAFIRDGVADTFMAAILNPQTWSPRLFTGEPMATLWAAGEARWLLGPADSAAGAAMPTAWLIRLDRGAGGDNLRMRLMEEGISFLAPEEDGSVPLIIRYSLTPMDSPFVFNITGLNAAAPPADGDPLEESDDVLHGAIVPWHGGGTRRANRLYSLFYLDNGFALIGQDRDFMRAAADRIAQHPPEPLPPGVAARLDVDLSALARRNRSWVETTAADWVARGVASLRDARETGPERAPHLDDPGTPPAWAVPLIRYGSQWLENSLLHLAPQLNEILESAPFLGRLRIDGLLADGQSRLLLRWQPEPDSDFTRILSALCRPEDVPPARLMAALPASALSWGGDRNRFFTDAEVGEAVLQWVERQCEWLIPDDELRPRFVEALSRGMHASDGSTWVQAAVAKGADYPGGLQLPLPGGNPPTDHVLHMTLAAPSPAWNLMLYETPLAGAVAESLEDLIGLSRDLVNHVLAETAFPARLATEFERLAVDDIPLTRLRMALEAIQTGDGVEVPPQTLAWLQYFLDNRLGLIWARERDRLYVMTDASVEGAAAFVGEMEARLAAEGDAGGSLGARRGFTAAYPGREGAAGGMAGVFMADQLLAGFTVPLANQPAAVEAIRRAVVPSEHPWLFYSGAADGALEIDTAFSSQGLREIVALLSALHNPGAGRPEQVDMDGHPVDGEAPAPPAPGDIF